MTDTKTETDPAKRAHIIDIFSSVQGEGLHVGERQIFIRFSGCNLNCCFCDTTSGPGPSVLDIQEVLSKVDILNEPSLHNSVSLTGGEPLVHWEFLKSLLPHLVDRGLKIYLETNGTLYKQLRSIIDLVDTIAVDIKLPSVSKNPACWSEHSEFIKIACAKDIFIKIVVSGDLDAGEFEKALGLIKDINMDMPVVIQPKTMPDSSGLDITGEELLDLQSRALRCIDNVFVIPQIHKILGVK